MALLSNVYEALKGKKGYIVGAGMIITGLCKDPIDVDLCWQGASIMALRAGLVNANTKLAKELK
jgi:hypothetical protein